MREIKLALRCQTFGDGEQACAVHTLLHFRCRLLSIRVSHIQLDKPGVQLGKVVVRLRTWRESSSNVNRNGTFATAQCTRLNSHLD